MSTYLQLALMGVLTGIPLGFAVVLGRFGSLGPVQDLMNGNSYHRLFMWIGVMGWSFIGMGILVAFSSFDLSRTLYLTLTPNYLAHIFGGLIFGLGMAGTGYCGMMGLARIGQGNLRTLGMILVVGICAYIAASGLLSPLRQFLFFYWPNDPNTSLPSWANGENPQWVFWLLGSILVLMPMTNAKYRGTRGNFWSIIVATSIVSAWWATDWILGKSTLDWPSHSHSFARPIGDTISYLMFSSGSYLQFPIGSVSGVILGGYFAGKLAKAPRTDMTQTSRKLGEEFTGAALMGVGALIAFGCSIGQGLSAMALLYYGAPISIVSMFCGAYLGLKYWIKE